MGDLPPELARRLAVLRRVLLAAAAASTLTGILAYLR
jgi:hypothetical protein